VVFSLTLVSGAWVHHGGCGQGGHGGLSGVLFWGQKVKALNSSQCDHALSVFSCNPSAATYISVARQGRQITGRYKAVVGTVVDVYGCMLCFGGVLIPLRTTLALWMPTMGHRK
jgi:hypothetical protein